MTFPNIKADLVEALHTAVLNEIELEPGSAEFGMKFEQMTNELLMGVGRAVVERQLSAFEPDQGRRNESGEVWTRVLMSTGAYISRFGKVEVRRGLYRSVRNGPTRCPVEESFGVFDGSWTPDAARLASLLLSDQTSRFSAMFLHELGGMRPSRSKLEQLPTRINETTEANRNRLETELRCYEIPDEAVTVAVSLDGVMVKLQGKSTRGASVQAARRMGRKVGGPVGSSEAAVGALSLYDANGKRLLTRRFARMPEANKTTLKQTLREELKWIRSARPDLVTVAVSDGAPNNWSFLEELEPDHEIVDAFHTLENIKRRLDRALGVGSHENQATYAALKDTLLDEPDGHISAFASLEKIEKRKNTYKERRKKGRGTQPTFYERHSGRMAYRQHREANLPIGSGVIEGTARYMVVDRLRRTGMRWKHPGGQGVLTLRQFAANNQFNQAWSSLMAMEAANDRKRWRTAA